MNNNLLSFLGLALRGGRLEVGEEPVSLAAQGGRARLLLAASDASGNTLRRVEHLAEAGQCLWLIIPFSKTELGGALGRSSVAMTAVTDLGMASAVVRRLAAMDPERYGDASERMALKVRRAAERRTTPPREKTHSRRPPGPPRGPRRSGEAFHSRERRGPGPKPYTKEQRPYSKGNPSGPKPSRDSRPPYAKSGKPHGESRTRKDGRSQTQEKRGGHPSGPDRSRGRRR